MASKYPETLLYTKDHEWCRIDGDVATIGITWHAQNALGDVVNCELPEVGTDVQQGQAFGGVDSTKAFSELYAPLSGTVIERNPEVIASPGMLNTDCYSSWMLRVRISDKAETKNLLSAKDYVGGLPEDE